MNRSDRHRAVFWGLALGAVGIAVLRAWLMRWTHDDAYVTFRYVDNFLRGWGLVANLGERVEGFTHPLWLGILIAVQGLGGSPVEWSMRLGVACLLGIMALVVVWSRRHHRMAREAMPFTALCLMLHYDYITWATGGLETALLGLVLAGAFTVYFFTSWPRPWKLIIVGVCLTAAAGARPDAALFYFVGLAALAVRAWLQQRPLRETVLEVALFCLPAGVLYGPWLVWKIGYYGALLPNTYYVKSGGGMQWGTGLFYLWFYFHIYVMSAFFAVGYLVASYQLARRVWQGGRAAVAAWLAEGQAAAFVVALTGIGAYVILFVIRVGGDYMFARMLMPLLPFIYWTMEWMLVRALAGRRRLLLAATVLLPLVILPETMWRHYEVKPREENIAGFSESFDRNYGITDEYWFYTAKVFGGHRFTMREMQRIEGLVIGEALQGLDVTILMGARNAFAYYSRLPMVIEYFGLTDAFIAHQPPDLSLRPGHQKAPTFEYLRERRVNFYMEELEGYEPEPYQVCYIVSGTVQFPLYTFCYDGALMKEIKGRLGSRFLYTSFPEYLDSYFKYTMPSRTAEDLAADYERFRDYYFRFTPDDAREQILLARLGELNAIEETPAANEQGGIRK